MSNKEHCRRLAAQIYAQLPEDRSEALLTIQYVRDIMQNLGGRWTQAGVIPLFPQRGQGVAPAAYQEAPSDPLDTANPALRQSEAETVSQCPDRGV